MKTVVMLIPPLRCKVESRSIIYLGTVTLYCDKFEHLGHIVDEDPSDDGESDCEEEIWR